ncbi:hypothetical protein M427DRAFT_28173 [Gonapodya prolifera JEL478]|uniref:TmcB/TmcC TPR repeats domain-containing protein n=1 Tax=Gonapodya prolifera (strain JEL478) TaxID=1344416 RepID=A0A139AUP7_GONPJ|nr:hypothetical protein M427DRAFT_28173 [Gonapodya prolifera JEL478]|eukprot:KXS20452.1 hypothetical protein M427DRAFT_28173 [Gonapodya prolifera JEL478]
MSSASRDDILKGADGVMHPIIEDTRGFDTLSEGDRKPGFDGIPMTASDGGETAARRRAEREQMVKRSRIEKTVFSVLNAMVTGNEVPSMLAYPLTILEDLQLLYFSWNPGYNFPGMPEWLPYLFNPLAIRPTDYSSYIILFSFAMLIITALVGTATFCSISFSQGKFKYIFPLQVLRAGTLLAVGVLNIPIIEILVTVLDCHNGSLKEYPKVGCFTNPGHLIPFFLAVIGLVIFCPYSLIMGLVYVDGNPKSPKNPMSKANGRSDFLYLLVKLSAVFVWQLVDSPLTKLAFLVVALFIISRDMILRQPFHNEVLQSFRSGIFMTSFISAVIAIIGVAINAEDSNSIVPFGLLCGSLLPGFLLGSLMTHVVKSRTIKRVYARLKKHIKEIRERTGATSFGVLPKGYKEQGRRVSEKDLGPHVLDVIADNMDRLTTEKHSDEPPAAFHQFPRDGYVHIQAAFYLLAFGGDTTCIGRHEETNAEKAEDILIKLAAMRVAFDVRFQAFNCEKQIEQSRKSREVEKSDMNISSFVEMMSQEKYAKTYHIESLVELKTFWTLVRRSTTPKDYLTYPSYLVFIARATNNAASNYNRLIQRFPKSKMVLRLYGLFHESVIADLDESRRLLTLADELEDGEVGGSFHHIPGQNNSGMHPGATCFDVTTTVR